MHPETDHFYRPAVGWGIAIGVVAFVAEYFANDSGLGRALLWTVVSGTVGGVFFARLLTLGERPRRRPRLYTPPQTNSEEAEASGSALR